MISLLPPEDQRGCGNCARWQRFNPPRHNALGKELGVCPSRGSGHPWAEYPYAFQTTHERWICSVWVFDCKHWELPSLPDLPDIPYLCNNKGIVQGNEMPE